MSQRLSIEELAAVPRWDDARIAELPGKIRGNALRAWGTHVARHWGPQAPDLVRRKLGVSAAALPDAPGKRNWLPMSAQIQLAHVIVDEWLGGDMLAFESVFAETSGTGDKVMRWVASKLGPIAVLKRSGSYHKSVCTVGKVTPDVTAHRAILAFEGAAVFGNPSWRLLNVMAMRTMMVVMRRPLDVAVGIDTGPEAFTIELGWR